MKRLHFWLLLIVFLLTFQLSGYSQRTTLEHIQQDDGLPSDLVKSVVMDNDGFIWAATDDGLAKIEGSKIVLVEDPINAFEMYKTIHVSKNYGMLATADGGIVAIDQSHKGIQTDFFSKKFSVSNFKSYKYAKIIHESIDSSLWMASTESVIRIANNECKEYKFSEKNHTYNFFRSYQFIEPDKDHFYILSQKGYLHFYNTESDSITEIPWRFAGTEIFYAYKINKHKYLLGCAEGLFQINFINGKIQDIINLDFDYPVSVICQKSENEFIIGTWEKGAYTLLMDQGKPSYNLLHGSEGHMVIDIILDNQKQVWLATSSGILFFRHMVFNLPFKELLDANIKNFTHDRDGTIYFSCKNIAYSINTKQQLQQLYALKSGEISSLALSKQGKLLGTSGGTIIYKKRNRKDVLFDFSENGGEIYSLVVDKNSDIWFLQYRQQGATLLKMDGSGKVLDLTPKVIPGGDYNINRLELSPEGELYVVAGGINQYLYRYNYTSGVIENISIPMKDLEREFLWTFDLHFIDEQSFFIASHRGVYKYHNEVMEHYNLGFHASKTNFSVTLDNSDRVWSSVHNGILCYNKGITILYNDSDGLPSKFLNPGGLIVDAFDNLWVGTTSGLVTSKIPSEFKPSSRPVITNIKKSGVSINPKENRFLENSILQFNFASPDYSAQYVLYEYSVNRNNKDDDWIELERKKDYLFFDHLKTGAYQLKIRAKSKGHFTWSEPVVYNFKIYKIWYKRTEIIIVINLVLLFLVYLYIRYYRIKSAKKQEELENIIRLRTREIVLKNKQLVKTQKQLVQSEKMATVGLLAAGIAHEINNPVNFISGGLSALKKSYTKLSDYLSEYKRAFDGIEPNDEKNLLLPNENQVTTHIELSEDMFETIEEGVIRTKNIVQSIRGLSSGSNAAFSEVDVNDVIDNVLLTLSDLYQNRIKIIKDFAPNSKLIGISTNIRLIFMNLIGNAIQAVPENGTIWITTKEDKQLKKLIIRVKDDGTGMSEEVQKKIFDPFFTTKDVGKGTGLGLYLTYRYVEQHHGSIKVHSEEGIGTEFIIKLPIDENIDG